LISTEWGSSQYDADIYRIQLNDIEGAQQKVFRVKLCIVQNTSQKRINIALLQFIFAAQLKSKLTPKMYTQPQKVIEFCSVPLK